jgi:pantetheine-phosphate adenylyltransferase
MASGPVIYPGTFDPPTLGHLDVIGRAAKLFDALIVAVTSNPQKQALFTLEQRVAMLAELTADLPNVSVVRYTGLTVDFVRDKGGIAILRGLRSAQDFEYELRQVVTNRIVAGVETIFLPATERYAHTSSTLIKQIAAGGGDVSGLVPPTVAAKLAERFGKGQ